MAAGGSGMDKMTGDPTLKDHREYAWQYFSLHAQQRMSLFNFFVVFSSLAVTGLSATFQEKTRSHTIGIGFGILLMVVSFIFWRLEERVRFLIKHAENALKWIENKCPLDNQQDEPHELCLFTREESRTEGKQPYTYSRCFRLAFLVFGLVGLVGAVASIICLIGPTIMVVGGRTDGLIVSITNR
jgi:hypothetical protein